jgi:hypothetical protein
VARVPFSNNAGHGTTHPPQGMGTALPGCTGAQRSLACRGVWRSLFAVWHGRPLARAGVRSNAVMMGKVGRGAARRAMGHVRPLAG